MKMNILIATSMAPVTEDGFKAVCEGMRAHAAQTDVTITGVMWAEGPGCSNLALACEGDEAAIEKVADHLTMAMMPAKWTTTGDTIAPVDLCRLSQVVVG